MMLNVLRTRFFPSISRIYLSLTSRLNTFNKIENPKCIYKIILKPCSITQYRYFSGISPPFITNISYEQLKEFIDQNEALIIDVRNKEELDATGVLPNSHNIPLDEITTAFKLEYDEFLKKYNISKPNKDQSIIFSCAKGIRSLKACQCVIDMGYKNIYNYPEGWFGWNSHKK